jgi:hypothetical protein
VFVHFIRDNEGPSLCGELSDKKKFFFSENFAGGVGRVADDDCFRILRERAAYLIRIKIELRLPQRNVDRVSADQNRVSSVVLVKRGENDDRIAWLQAVINPTSMASVPPQVTTKCSLGSKGKPIKRDCLAASASLNSGWPQVIAY